MENRISAVIWISAIEVIFGLALSMSLCWQNVAIGKNMCFYKEIKVFHIVSSICEVRCADLNQKERE